MRNTKIQSAMKAMINLFCFAILVIVVSCSPSKKELYSISDSFVESLQTTYSSYGILGGEEHLKQTSDWLYQVMPVGRLVNVKIMKAVSNDEYKELKEDLENHYKNDSRVKDVYINNGGTIMIDCRN